MMRRNLELERRQGAAPNGYFKLLTFGYVVVIIMCAYGRSLNSYSSCGSSTF